jgi:diguanylate cyclase (GGDEF)-like protein/PAS domain S-box-containing protein
MLDQGSIGSTITWRSRVTAVTQLSSKTRNVGLVGSKREGSTAGIVLTKPGSRESWRRPGHGVSVRYRTVVPTKICFTELSRDLDARDCALQDILLIQNDASDVDEIRDALIKSDDGSFRVVWVRRCADGLNALAVDRTTPHTVRFAAILVDLFLPDTSGIETFDLLFQAAPQIPILILTALHDEPVAKFAVQRGAQEYLLKGRLDAYLWPKAVSSMIERAASREALYEANQRAQVMLNSIGDAVMSTDLSGQVTYLNQAAQKLTGWSQQEAAGHPLEDVFPIIDGATRSTARNPMSLAIRENKPVGLTPNCILIRRDGIEASIEDSAAPIHDRYGQVTGAVMVFHDVSAARATTLRMSYLAQHDSLTDLPNRMLLDDRLAEALLLAHRHRRQLAVLFLDIDRFKHINDTLGHVIGDRLLQSIARRLVTCVRASDTVSRQGGDEFVILLAEVSDAGDATACADKILAALRSPHQIEGHDIHVTASIGVVTYPDDATDGDTLLKHADFAMYHAKENGRDNRQFFKQDMNVRALKRQSLENGVRRALEREEFRVHYQPKVNLLTGTIIGVEALIRWLHPDFGLVPPAEFIPIAEECGLIVPIGRWVLGETCHQAQAWRDIGLPPIRIGVNISPVQLRSSRFVADVGEILMETGFEAELLELELTETFLMQDPASTSTVLFDLSKLGVKIALDDFGTGYSSLTHLRRFPIDTLKIDRSFVSNVVTNSDDASIVSAMISMGKNLHVRVVAEGVETQEQLVFLQARECPFGQGHYFSKPLAAEECIQILRRGFASNGQRPHSKAF